MTVKKKTAPVVTLENKAKSGKDLSETKGAIPAEKTDLKPDSSEKGSSESENPKVVEHAEEPESSHNPIENLIGYIKVDQDLLEKANDLIDKAKEDKRDIADRLKDSRRDLATLYKYASTEQKVVLDELGFDMEQSNHGLNSVAQTALDILAKSKKQLTNEELYNEYVASLKVGEEPVNYTQFNIKLRSPLNTQLIAKKVVDDGQGSRTDIIYLNGGNSYN